MSYDYRFPSIADLKLRARKRMPGFAFDYVDGGIDEEHGKRRNRSAWHKIVLTPRYLCDVSTVDLTTRIFNHTYSMPFGVPPVGLGNMMWPGAEMALARAAQRANIPYILSTFSTTKMEDIARTAPDVCWFQLYVPEKIEVMEGLLERIKQAGYRVLVVTIDIPIGAKRNRELKNGLGRPFQLTPRIVWQCLQRPHWVLATLTHKFPDFVNVECYRENGNKQSFAQFLTSFNMLGVTRERIEKIRALWKGPLVLKGVQHEQDMRTALEIGVDGLIISNHGGRQLDAAPTSVESLQSVPREIRDKMVIMADSGIRTGLDVVRAGALGARMTFSGRAFFWGIGALGTKGGHQVVEIFRDEMTRTLQQLGCTAFGQTDQNYPIDQ